MKKKTILVTIFKRTTALGQMVTFYTLKLTVVNRWDCRDIVITNRCHSDNTSKFYVNTKYVLPHRLYDTVTVCDDATLTGARITDYFYV